MQSQSRHAGHRRRPKAGGDRRRHGRPRHAGLRRHHERPARGRAVRVHPDPPHLARAGHRVRLLLSLRARRGPGADGVGVAPRRATDPGGGRRHDLRRNSRRVGRTLSAADHHAEDLPVEQGPRHRDRNRRSAGDSRTSWLRARATDRPRRNRRLRSALPRRRRDPRDRPDRGGHPHSRLRQNPGERDPADHGGAREQV